MKDFVQTGCEMQDVSNYQYEWSENNHYGERVYHFTSKICQYKRDPKWAEHRDLSTNKKRVRDEVKITYAVIISGETDNKEKVDKTIQSIMTNELKPVHFGVFCRSIMSEKLDPVLNETGVPWQLIEYVAEEDYKTFALMHQNIHSHFFVFIKAGMEIEAGFFDRLDQMINDENFRFTYISNDDNSLLIMSKNLYYFNELPINELLIQLKAKNEGYVNYASISTNS